jgi:hypothetical protein
VAVEGSQVVLFAAKFWTAVVCWQDNVRRALDPYSRPHELLAVRLDCG